MHEPTAVLTVDEVAQLLRISRTAAYEAVNRGEIPAVRIGRRWLIPRAALDRMLMTSTEKEVAADE
jgi:excisionase family DNA binding protein